MSNIRSRAQLSHFTDVEPLCLACNVNSTSIHMFLQCQTMKSIVNSVLLELLNIADIELIDVFWGNNIDQKLKRVSHLVFGACLFTAYNLDKRLKPPNNRAAKNAAAQLCNLYARTPRGKVYFQGLPNIPILNLIN